jgi:hypothetical protein
LWWQNEVKIKDSSNVNPPTHNNDASTVANLAVNKGLVIQKLFNVFILNYKSHKQYSGIRTRVSCSLGRSDDHCARGQFIKLVFKPTGKIAKVGAKSRIWLCF